MEAARYFGHMQDTDSAGVSQYEFSTSGRFRTILTAKTTDIASTGNVLDTKDKVCIHRIFDISQ